MTDTPFDPRGPDIHERMVWLTVAVGDEYVAREEFIRLHDATLRNDGRGSVSLNRALVEPTYRLQAQQVSKAEPASLQVALTLIEDPVKLLSWWVTRSLPIRVSEKCSFGQ